MKKSIKLFLTALAVANFGCIESDECNVECFTPPAPFSFELVTKGTEASLFLNEKYNPDQIEVMNDADNSTVEHTFIDEKGLKIIQINSIGWETEKVNLSVLIGNEKIFDLYVDAERLSDGCCNFTIYNDINIENADWEFDAETGMYKIFIE